MRPHKLQLLQALRPDVKRKRLAFCNEILDNTTFPQCIVFSDEATFPVSDQVNKHILRIWGLQNTQAVI